MSRAEMKDRLVQFVGDDEPRFWSYAGAPWDWMAIAQLSPWPNVSRTAGCTPGTTCCCYSASADVRVDDPRLPPPPPDVHHALADARWASELHRAATRLLA
jgi:hypothetical protein